MDDTTVSIIAPVIVEHVVIGTAEVKSSGEINIQLYESKQNYTRILMEFLMTGMANGIVVKPHLLPAVEKKGE